MAKKTFDEERRENPFAGSTVADRTGSRAPVARHTGKLSEGPESPEAGDRSPEERPGTPKR